MKRLAIGTIGLVLRLVENAARSLGSRSMFFARVYYPISITSFAYEQRGFHFRREKYDVSLLIFFLESRN